MGVASNSICAGGCVRGFFGYGIISRSGMSFGVVAGQSGTAKGGASVRRVLAAIGGPLARRLPFPLATLTPPRATRRIDPREPRRLLLARNSDVKHQPTSLANRNHDRVIDGDPVHRAVTHGITGVHAFLLRLYL